MQRALPPLISVFVTVLGTVSGASPVTAQDLVVSGGDLVTEDSTGDEIFRLDADEARAEIGGDGEHGEFAVQDASGNKPLQFTASTADLTVGFSGASAGQIRVTNGNGWPTYWISGGGDLEFFDGDGVLETDLLYEFDPSGPTHWGPRTGVTADYHFKSQDDVYIDLEQAGDGSSSSGLFRIRDNALDTVFHVTEDGDMFASGSKSAVVDTEDHGRVALYAVESPEVRFEDLGSAVLDDGATTVEIDPVFAQTVDLEDGYHVTLTAVCDEPVLLHVTSKRPTAFTVEGWSPEGWRSDCAFDWRLSAHRKGFEDRRLEGMREIEQRRVEVEHGLRPGG